MVRLFAPLLLFCLVTGVAGTSLAFEVLRVSNDPCDNSSRNLSWPSAAARVDIDIGSPPGFENLPTREGVAGVLEQETLDIAHLVIAAKGHNVPFYSTNKRLCRIGEIPDLLGETVGEVSGMTLHGPSFRRKPESRLRGITIWKRS